MVYNKNIISWQAMGGIYQTIEKRCSSVFDPRQRVISSIGAKSFIATSSAAAILNEINDELVQATP